MRMTSAISFGLAAAVSLMLFSAFGSVGVERARASVDASVSSMHAVLPDGALVKLRGV